MKRFFLLLTSFALISTAAFADKEKAIAVEQLPQTSQAFIKEYFANASVLYAKMDTELFDKSYEVGFTDGCKVEFNKKGEWKSVECKHAEVPTGIVPQKIQQFIAKNQHGAKVVEIDKDSKGYELKLNNRVEPKFDISQNFIGYDD